MFTCPCGCGLLPLLYFTLNPKFILDPVVAAFDPAEFAMVRYPPPVMKLPSG